ncbi:3-deoxy-manno-octulosonate cytidylyltransferase [Candidatus Omnitrophota bacterium]
MKAIGVIPARYESSRFPGKCLAPIFDRPLIQYTYEAALKATSLEELLIATDDERIVQAVEKFGGRAVLTAKEHQSGTDRLTEVVNPIDAEIVVNIQADEPLIHFSMINDLVDALEQQSDPPMATLIHRIEDQNELRDPNVVKAVKDKNNFAIYFSRSLIPHPRSSFNIPDQLLFYKHIGLYAYTKDFLFTFTNLPVGELEQVERLEQLRALEHGYKIKLIETNFDTIGVDTPEDLEKVKARIQKEKARSV